MSGTYSDLLNAQHASNALSAIANPGQVNILGAYNAASQTGANMLNLQKLLAEKAVGGAAQGAINPDTGEYDPNAFRKNLVAAGPQAAFGAQAGLQNNQSLSDAQLNQARVKLQFVQSRAGALLDKPTITPQDVLGVFQQGIASGVMTMPEVARQMQIVQGLDANGLRQWAAQHAQSAVAAQTQLERTYGTTTLEDVGGAKVPVTTRPAGPNSAGATSVGGGGVATGLTPEQLATQVPFTDPSTGQKSMLPLGEILRRQGATPPTGGAQLGTGRPPAALRNPNAPAATPPAPDATQPAPAAAQPPAVKPFVAGLTPEQEAQRQAQGTSSNASFDQEAQAGTQAQTQRAVLGNMLADAGQFVPGPGAEGIQKVRATLQRVANMFGGSLGQGMADKLASQDSFDKFAAQLANAQGAGSDNRLAVIQAATPHASLTPGGVDLVIRQLQGNTDYLEARSKLAAAYPDKQDYRSFQAKIQSDLDPRAFQYNRMTSDQRTTYWKNLDQAGRDALKKAYKFAEDNKFLSNP
jgi:hypothetical protein